MPINPQLKKEYELQREIQKYNLYFNQKEDLEYLTHKWKLLSKRALMDLKSDQHSIKVICDELGIDIQLLGEYDADRDTFL